MSAPWRRVLLLAAASMLASCDHYDAADVPGPRPTPAPAPSASFGGETTADGSSPSTLGATSEPCTPILAPQPTAVVEVIRAADGSCVAAADAVAYRCDPTLDPVVALGLGGKVRRFLGGRFATRLPEVPLAATPIGVAAAGRLWSVPGDRASLVVEGSAGVERWLSLPRRRVVAAALPSALVIGDSLMDGAREELVAAVPAWTLTIDAEVGRGSYGAASAVEAVLSPAEVVVVEIGVNDHDPVGFAGNVDRIAAATDDPALLLWLTAHGPDPDIDDINREIVAGMGPLPYGAVADWDAFVPADALDPDGVHLLAERQGVMADLVAGRLRAWRQAALGEGATGCEGAIRSAVRDAS